MRRTLQIQGRWSVQHFINYSQLTTHFDNFLAFSVECKVLSISYSWINLCVRWIRMGNPLCNGPCNDNCKGYTYNKKMNLNLIGSLCPKKVTWYSSIISVLIFLSKTLQIIQYLHNSLEHALPNYLKILIKPRTWIGNVSFTKPVTFCCKLF